MLTNKPRVQLPEKIINYIMQLDFEANGLKVLHTHALLSGVNDEKQKMLYKMFQEKYAEFNLARNEILSEYGKEFIGKQTIIDYVEGVLRVVDKKE